MKAASGELNLTVITIIAISAVAGFFTYFMWPQIKETINTQWGAVSGGGDASDSNLDASGATGAH